LTRRASSAAQTRQEFEQVKGFVLRSDRQNRQIALTAALCTLLGALFFSLMNAAAKYLGLRDQQLALELGADHLQISIFQITFARYAVASLMMLPFMFARQARFRPSSPKRYVVRTIAGFGGIALMFAAIQTVPLASATAIGFTSPIFTMIFSAALLGERVRQARWLAGSLGLIGALIIASPGSGVPLVGATLALTAAAFMGAEVVAVKWLAQSSDSAVTILFYSNLAGMSVSSLFMLPGFVWPTQEQAQVLILVGLMAILGQACIIRAAKLSDANFIAPFFYVSLLFAAIIGYVIFGETITFAVAAGCFVIILSASLMISTRR